MNLTTPLRRGTFAAALTVASVGAYALPTFTLNPAAAGLNGTSVTGENILVTDFAAVTYSGSTFSEHGYLPITAVQNGSQFKFGGLNDSYGLFVEFFGDGVLTSPTSSTFTSLTYTIYGYNYTAPGVAADFSSGPGVASVSGLPTTTALATGSLISGVGGFLPNGTPTASATLSFATTAAGASFFSPMPFYSIAFSSFTNTPSQVVFDGTTGFHISQGAGSFNFATTPAIPEPQTYALVLAGLAAVSMVARRRRN